MGRSEILRQPGFRTPPLVLIFSTKYTRKTLYSGPTAVPSALSLEKDGPIVGVGRGRRVPNRTVDGWKVDLFPGRCAEPKCAVAAGLELHGDLTTLRQIDCVGLAGIGEAVVAVVHQLVVRIGLPPRKAGEEIDHAAVAEEHGHSVVATAVKPPPAHVGADVGATANGFSSGLVGAGHC